MFVLYEIQERRSVSFGASYVVLLDQECRETWKSIWEWGCYGRAKGLGKTDRCALSYGRGRGTIITNKRKRKKDRDDGHLVDIRLWHRPERCPSLFFCPRWLKVSEVRNRARLLSGVVLKQEVVYGISTNVKVCILTLLNKRVAAAAAKNPFRLPSAIPAARQFYFAQA